MHLLVRGLGSIAPISPPVCFMRPDDSADGRTRPLAIQITPLTRQKPVRGNPARVLVQMET
jgi:hypothetical protein